MSSTGLNSTIGVLEIGLVISTYMFGLSTVQTVVYLCHASRDSMALKASVLIIWILEVLHIACFAHGTYTFTITDYGDPARLAGVPPTIFLSFLFSGLVGPVVQCIYAKRIRGFAGNYVVAALSWALSLLEAMGIVGLTVTSIRSATLAQLEREYSWLYIATIAVGAGNDLAIAVILCWYFKKQRKSALKRTARLIDMLILWTLNNGLLTSVAILTELLIVSIPVDAFLFPVV
ncbi:hypothetical protein PLICRDRAFT_174649 [Plicaturopsis crispa FD-325 SS-3]|nr:hypothetical protein PLICRDRAFT_174649 [Plicaturopsis crispa FD-325 SS-3]